MATPPAPAAAAGIPAGGAGHDATKPTERLLVSVVVGGADGDTSARLTDALRRSLDGLGLKLRLSSERALDVRQVIEAPPVPSELLRAWLDMGIPGLAVLYLTDGRTVFTRRFVLRQPIDSVGLDLLDVVISDSAAAVLAGRPVGIPRDEFNRSLELTRISDARARANDMNAAGAADSAASRRPPAATQPAAAATAVTSGAPSDGERGVRWSTGVLYEVTRLSAGEARHGFGVGLQGQRSRVRGGLSVQGHLPQEIAGSDVSLALRSAGARVFAGYAYALTPLCTVIGGAGVGADLQQVRPTVEAGDLVAVKNFWVAEPLVRPSLQWELRRRRVLLALTVAVDIALVESRYRATRPDRSQNVWEPARWRPVLGLSLTLPL